jgi:hypothetical protein
MSARLGRTQALDIAAGIIARQVPDLGGLILLLDDAGQNRLVAALRARLAQRRAEVGGTARPDPALWAAAGARGRL